jgi:hypothetical protein
MKKMLPVDQPPRARSPALGPRATRMSVWTNRAGCSSLGVQGGGDKVWMYVQYAVEKFPDDCTRRRDLKQSPVAIKAKANDKGCIIRED